MDAIYELKFWDAARCAWYIKFSVPSYAGEVEVLKGSGHPLKVEFTNGSDDFNDPWRPTQVKIEIQAGENWKFTDLFDPNIMYCWVEVYQGIDSDGELFFQGWVDPSQYEEPYDVPPFYLTITVVDGLKYLQDIMFAEEEHSDGSFTYYEDRALESEIIWDILSKIGVTEYEEYINLFEESMAMGTVYTPINQLLLERDRFYDMTCAETLTEILRKYGATIRQNFGIFQIYRPVEQYRSVVYGRHWTSKTAHEPISMTPIQYIHRTTTHQESALLQIPGGVQTRINPAKRININFEYGNRDTWIDNPSFHVNSYDIVTRLFEHWNTATIYGYAALPISDIVPKEEEGVALRNGVAISQSFGEYTRSAPDTEQFRLEFEYGFYNKATAFKDDVVASFVIIQTASDIPLWAQGKYLLKNSTEATELTWVPLDYSGSANYSNTVPMDDVGHGWTGWQTASFTFKGLPYTRPLSIQFINRYSDSVYVCIRNVRFVAASTELSKITYQRSIWERIKAGRAASPMLIGGAYFMKAFIPTAWRFGAKYILKDKYTIVDNITEATYNPISDVDHGDVRDYDFILGDIVKESVPTRKGDTGITNNLEQFAGSFAVQAMQSVEAAIQDFIAAWADYWSDFDVLLDYDENSAGVPMLLFKAANPGTDFGTAAAIGSMTGDVDGIAYVVTANQAGTRRLVELTITGSDGYVTITIEGISRDLEYRLDNMSKSIYYFINQYDFVYAAVGITLDIDSTGEALLILGDVYGNDFTYSTGSGMGLTATETYSVAASAIGQRTDGVEITGTSGTAVISCNGGSKTFAFSFAVTTPSAEWCAGDDSSDAFPHKPLLHIIGDEIMAQYSRAKYMVQMPILEKIVGTRSGLNINGCIVDTEFKNNGVNRKFVINRGTFDARHRMWELDLVELLPYDGVQAEIEESGASYDSDEQPGWDSGYIPGNEGNIPSSEDFGVTLNHIDTITDGRQGTAMSVSFEYTAAEAKSGNIIYYFSSDAAGTTPVTPEYAIGVDFVVGTHTQALTGIVYPTYTGQYLQIYLQDDEDEAVTSNAFQSILIVLNSIATIPSPQATGEAITPDATFNFTATGGTGVNVTIHWNIRNASDVVVASGSQEFSFSTGTDDYSFSAVTLPSTDYEDCTLNIGFSSGAKTITSNTFTIASI